MITVIIQHSLDHRKAMPCGCIMEWDEGVFRLSLCSSHARDFEARKVMEY